MVNYYSDIFYNYYNYNIVAYRCYSNGNCKNSINYDFINGHLGISCCGSLSLSSIEYREAVKARIAEILKFYNKI